MDNEDITPEGSIVPVFLDPTPEVLPSPLSEDPEIAIRRAAVEHLMTTFGFTEEMARTVVGN